MSYKQRVACDRRVLLRKLMQWRLRNHKQSTLSLLRLYACVFMLHLLKIVVRMETPQLLNVQQMRALGSLVLQG